MDPQPKPEQHPRGFAARQRGMDRHVSAGLTGLAGDFSLILWNQQERKLIAFRDLTGSRPFFYSHADGIFMFGNTLQALLAAPWASRELDEVFLGDFLLGSPNHDLDRSVYKDIRRLPVGHLLQFSSHGITTRRIANMPVEEPLMLSEREYIEEFRRLFTQAVSDQLAPMSTTIMLSGGLDSTTLAACAVSLRKNLSPLSNVNLRPTPSIRNRCTRIRRLISLPGWPQTSGSNAKLSISEAFFRSPARRIMKMCSLNLPPPPTCIFTIFTIGRW